MLLQSCHERLRLKLAEDDEDVRVRASVVSQHLVRAHEVVVNERRAAVTNRSHVVAVRLTTAIAVTSVIVTRAD